MKPMLSTSEIQAMAGRCVKCGLCLPHCPTWQVHRREGDSPRGRIELVSALAGGRMEADPTLQARLDGCLLCRACERVCPARVPFGNLMDQARWRWPARKLWWSRLFRPGIGRSLLRFGLWFGVISRIANLARAIPGLRLGALAGLLPDAVAPRRAAIAQTDLPKVGVFTGCVSDIVDRQTLNAAAALLARCEVQPVWIEGSGCCGALDRHQGDAAVADAHLQANVRQIDFGQIDALVSVATGCSAELVDYAGRLDGQSAQDWRDKHWEILAYLHAKQDRLSFRPLDKTVLLHHPCSARNVLRDTRSASALLRKIPNLRLIESGQARCCGAAGTAMFRTPQTAQTLARDVVEEVLDCGAEVLVTANIGCALHLRQACRAAGRDVVVRHPVNLLQEQLQESAS